MGRVMIRCPKTGRELSTGMETDRASFNRTPVFFGRTFCPTCRTHHEWFAKDAWVREGRYPSSRRTAQRKCAGALS
jgi:hypothetical protein